VALARWDRRIEKGRRTAADDPRDATALWDACSEVPSRSDASTVELGKNAVAAVGWVVRQFYNLVILFDGSDGETGRD
jgi:hypothetical protein